MSKEDNWFTLSGWQNLDSWNGIVPGSKFYKVGGILSTGVLQVFICGAIVRREPRHGKIVDGKWQTVGDAQVMITCVDEAGTPVSRMTAYEAECVATEEAALQLIQAQVTRKIMFKRKQAATLLAEADVLEAEGLAVDRKEFFAVDLDEIPVDHFGSNPK